MLYIMVTESTLYISPFLKAIPTQGVYHTQTRHLLDEILRLSVCLLFIVSRGRVRFLGEVGVLVYPHLR